MNTFVRKTPFLLLLVLAAASAAAEVSFAGLDLAAGHRLLFRADTDIPGQDPYSTLFYADLRTSELRQLTFYPEKLQILSETKQLQVQNRFGLFRTDSELKNLSPVERFPSFAAGRSIQSGKIFPVQSSPDGRFLLYFEPTSPAYAELRLIDLTNGREELVSNRVELSLSGPMATWAPNSKFFIYAKTGVLYYYSIEQLLTHRVMGEKFRSLGEGSLSSARWGNEDDLYFISGSLVYQILGVELFARSLYRNVLRIGRIAGKLPFDFDPNFDEFWVAPDGKKMLLAKAGRNVFVYQVQADDFTSAGVTLSLPYLFLPRNTRVRKVLWSAADIVTILCTGIERGSSFSTVFRVDLKTGSTAFAAVPEIGVRDLVLSPDGRRVAVLLPDSVSFRSYAEWTELRRVSYDAPLHAAWYSDAELVVGGRRLIQVISADSGAARFVAAAQPDAYGFKDSVPIYRTEGIIRTYDPVTGVVGAAEKFDPAAPAVASSAYRVYLEPSSLGSYRNMVMVRDIQGLGTRTLFKAHEERYEPFPDTDDPVDFSNFSHGSRIRRREVALVFNAIDSVEGLAEILNVLAEYRIRATFFVNGEFIRRNPGATKAIAESGHEVGSLFFAYFDMTDPQFQVTKEFIQQGLARNEDDYFAATGRELSLLWHAPYYFVNSAIIDASRELNYLYVGRDVDSLDWVVKRDDAGISPLYAPSADLVERILELKRPGSIVSMRVGTPRDDRIGFGRDDYLFQRLDLLINLLSARGYRVVPVSSIVETAR